MASKTEDNENEDDPRKRSISLKSQSSTDHLLQLMLALDDPKLSDWELGSVHEEIGQMLIPSKEYVRALTHFEKANDFWIRYKDIHRQSRTVGKMGKALVAKGDGHNGLRRLAEALELAKQGGVNEAVAVASYNLGMVEMRMGKTESAEFHLESALLMAREEDGCSHLYDQFNSGLGLVKQIVQEKDKTVFQYHEEAYKYAQGKDDAMAKYRCLSNMGSSLLLSGASSKPSKDKAIQAAGYFRSAAVIAKKDQRVHFSLEITAMYHCARAFLAADDTESALQIITDIDERLREIDDARGTTAFEKLRAKNELDPALLAQISNCQGLVQLHFHSVERKTYEPRLEEALFHFKQGLSKLEGDTPEKELLGTEMLGMEGLVDSVMGNSSVALETFKLAYDRMRKSDDLLTAEKESEGGTYRDINSQLEPFGLGTALARLNPKIHENQRNGCLRNLGIAMRGGVGMGVAFDHGSDKRRMKNEELREARVRHEKELQHAAEIQDPRQMALAHGNIGACCFALELYQEAYQQFKLQHDLAQMSNDRVIYARALRNLGDVNEALGEMRKSFQAFKECLNVAIELNNEVMEADVCQKLATVYTYFSNLGAESDQDTINDIKLDNMTEEEIEQREFEDGDFLIQVARSQAMYYAARYGELSHVWGLTNISFVDEEGNESVASTEFYESESYFSSKDGFQTGLALSIDDSKTTSVAEDDSISDTSDDDTTAS